jgi:hypothetical protein
VPVEYAETRALYLQDPERALRLAGVSTDPVSRSLFEGRLLGSNEPTATFALANSLAGFLVGPAVLVLAVVLENLRRRDDDEEPPPGSRLAALALGPGPPCSCWPACS